MNVKKVKNRIALKDAKALKSQQNITRLKEGGLLIFWPNFFYCDVCSRFYLFLGQFIFNYILCELQDETQHRSLLSQLFMRKRA
jgi:hypothetical protein